MLQITRETISTGRPDKGVLSLIAIHIAAALRHLLVGRDGVFERMWPRRAHAARLSEIKA